jgi:hypothetical protein
LAGGGSLSFLFLTLISISSQISTV